MLHDFDSLESNPILGASWEGFVIEQIAQKIKTSTQSYFYRTHEGAECDLVLTRGRKVLVAIEIKYTSSPKITKGMLNAFDDINAKDNYIISPSTDDYLIANNIRVCNLSTFMKSIYHNSISIETQTPYYQIITSPNHQITTLSNHHIFQ